MGNIVSTILNESHYLHKQLTLNQRVQGSSPCADLCDAWQAFGKPALETMAMLYPAEFVCMAASLIPKEPEAITAPVMERLSNAQLDALIARCIEDGLDPAATDEDAQIIQ